jgi:hypothetical protein
MRTPDHAFKHLLAAVTPLSVATLAMSSSTPPDLLGEVAFGLCHTAEGIQNYLREHRDIILLPEDLEALKTACERVCQALSLFDARRLPLGASGELADPDAQSAEVGIWRAREALKAGCFSARNLRRRWETSLVEPEEIPW